MLPTWTVPEAGSPALHLGRPGRRQELRRLVDGEQREPHLLGGEELAERRRRRRRALLLGEQVGLAASEACASCCTERRTRTAPATSDRETATMTARPIAPNRRARSDLTDG